MAEFVRKGVAYNSEEEADLAAVIPYIYLDRPLDAGYIAEAILDSDWLAEHDRQVAEKAWGQGYMASEAWEPDTPEPLSPYRAEQASIRLETDRD